MRDSQLRDTGATHLASRVVISSEGPLFPSSCVNFVKWEHGKKVVCSLLLRFFSLFCGGLSCLKQFFFIA